MVDNPSLRRKPESKKRYWIPAFAGMTRELDHLNCNATRKRRMRVLADENMSGLTVSLLRASGHDVMWVREERPRTPDLNVLEWATQESRLLITFDTDFGEINQRDGHPAPFGIILFRNAEEVPSDEAARLITQNVNAQVEWPGYLWAMTIRKRPAV